MYNKDLIEVRQKAILNEDTSCVRKLENVGRLKGGATIGIKWKDYDQSDIGYLFQMPEMEDDVYDYYIHVPQPQNPIGMDTAPPVWTHLIELLSNEMVVKITVL